MKSLGKFLYIMLFIYSCSGQPDSGSRSKAIIGSDDRRDVGEDTMYLDTLGVIYNGEKKCNAFVSGEKKITTTAHCIDDIIKVSDYKFSWSSGKYVSVVKVLSYSESNDIAVLEVGYVFRTFLTAGQFQNKEKADLISLDVDNNFRATFRSCNLIGNNNGLFYHDCDTSKGNSGSVLVQNGVVVAMHLGYSKKRKLNVALDLSHLNYYVKSVDKNDLDVECWATCVASTVGGAITGVITGVGSLLPTGPIGASIGGAVGGLGGGLLGAAAGGCFENNQCVDIAPNIDTSTVTTDSDGTQTQNFFSGGNLVGFLKAKHKSLAIREGYFRIEGTPEVFWSNGGDAYCWIPSPKYLSDLPIALHQMDVHKATYFRRDGACPGMQG